MYRSNLAIIISSPSGAGKTTIARKLIKKIKNSYLSVSCTTRDPRQNEKHGIDYFFVNKDKFKLLKEQKKFLESAKVYGNFYGTLKSELKRSKKNAIALFDVDWQGSRSIKKALCENCYSFFLLPPSLEVLKKRLMQRHANNNKIAIQRFSQAKKDIRHWHEYDFIHVNNNLNKCVKEIFDQIMYLSKISKDRNKIKKFVKKF